VTAKEMYMKLPYLYLMYGFQREDLHDKLPGRDAVERKVYPGNGVIGEGGGAEQLGGGATRQMKRQQFEEPMVNAARLPTDLPGGKVISRPMRRCVDNRSVRCLIFK